MKPHAPALTLLFGAALGMAGCKPQTAAALAPTALAAAASAHEHHVPHGGTAVVLGDEAYHLEFVRDAATGVMQVYVLDGEMENFIRITAPEFAVTVTRNGETIPLVFKAVADAATGEKVGDTALFEATADWLKTTAEFDGTLSSLSIRGTVFENVKFNFPHGNETH